MDFDDVVVEVHTANLLGKSVERNTNQQAIPHLCTKS